MDKKSKVKPARKTTVDSKGRIDKEGYYVLVYRLPEGRDRSGDGVILIKEGKRYYVERGVGHGDYVERKMDEVAWEFAQELRPNQRVEIRIGLSSEL